LSFDRRGPLSESYVAFAELLGKLAVNDAVAAAAAGVDATNYVRFVVVGK
jgi:hypothetical protein